MAALTQYNSYRYQPGRYNLYDPHELAAIAAADAEIEADHAARIGGVRQAQQGAGAPPEHQPRNCAEPLLARESRRKKPRRC